MIRRLNEKKKRGQTSLQDLIREETDRARDNLTRAQIDSFMYGAPAPDTTPIRGSGIGLGDLLRGEPGIEGGQGPRDYIEPDPRTMQVTTDIQNIGGVSTISQQG